MTETRPGIGWWVMLVLAAVIAAYAFTNVALDEAFYPPNLKDSFLARPWGIMPHAFFGGIAMILGPFQFHRGLLRRRPRHRLLGKIYVVSGLIAGAAGLYLAPYSYGGMITHLGFGGLAVALLTATWRAYRSIKGRDVAAHREWMIVSYALIYAAVTLRIEIPTLMAVTRGDFDLTYRIVSWLCWVPNLAVAAAYVIRSRPVAGAALPAYGA